MGVIQRLPVSRTRRASVAGSRRVSRASALQLHCACVQNTRIFMIGRRRSNMTGVIDPQYIAVSLRNMICPVRTLLLLLTIMYAL